MKINLYSLIVEVTRRCNMHCEHCLRGEAQNLDIPFSTIDKALEQVDSIGILTISGGEPSLNVPAMRHILDVCRERQIPVDGFYVITNGKSVTKEFVLLCLEWYVYVVVECNGDAECCGVAMSEDAFHEEVDNNAAAMLQGLAFYRDSHKTDYSKVLLINEGRAKAIANAWDTRELSIYAPEIEISGDFLSAESDIYISANGDVRCCCDTAYNDARATLGNLNDKSLVDILTAAEDCRTLEDIAALQNPSAAQQVA